MTPRIGHDFVERPSAPGDRAFGVVDFSIFPDPGHALMPENTLATTSCESGEMSFPDGFFARDDPAPDGEFYRPPRFVTHIDDAAVAAVGALYAELDLRGHVLDLMGSWVSHFRESPTHLTVLGMNAAELAANPQADDCVLHDLNADPRLPFGDGAFDAIVCCVSIDYLVDPVAVFTDVARVVRPEGLFVCTFSNRLFPTKAVRGWLYATEEERRAIAAEYFRASGVWGDPVAQRRTPAGHRGDPLDAVWAHRRPGGSSPSRVP